MQASMTQIAFHSSSPFSLSSLSYSDSAVSTPLHLQSDLCYSSLWFLCVQRRQDVSNWKGCDGAGGPSLGLGGPQRLRGQGEPVSHWHVGLDGSIQSQQAWGSAISSSSVRRGTGKQGKDLLPLLRVNLLQISNCTSVWYPHGAKAQLCALLGLPFHTVASLKPLRCHRANI